MLLLLLLMELLLWTPASSEDNSLIFLKFRVITTEPFDLGDFDGDINGGFSETSGFNSSISSVWSMENGEDAKSGGNTIGIGSSNTSGAGVSYTGSTWGSFEQGSLSTFEGTSSVATNSWFLQGGGD